MTRGHRKEAGEADTPVRRQTGGAHGPGVGPRDQVFRLMVTSPRGMFSLLENL